MTDLMPIILSDFQRWLTSRGLTTEQALEVCYGTIVSAMSNSGTPIQDHTSEISDVGMIYHPLHTYIRGGEDV